VEAAQLPPLRPVDSKQTFCLQKPGLVLPAEGAPLVFSTKLAHRLVLELKGKLPLQQTQERRLPGTPEAGQRVELPAKADPVRGGLAIDTKLLPNADLGTDLIGTVRGQWGFQTFDGPSFRLQSAQPRVWVVPAADKSALIVGREDVLHLEADDAACVSEITVKDKKGQAVKAEWKLVKPDELELKLPLKDAAAGPMSIMLKKYGLSKADELSLLAYSEPGHLDGLVIHAGDRHSVLQGTRLDEVASLELNGMHFLPAGLARAGQKDQLRLAAQTAAGDPLQVDEKVKAKVALKDGRVLEVQTTVGAPRPKVKLISKSVQGPARSAVRLATEDDLPQDGRLSFFLQAEVPQTFPRGFKIEVATEDGSSQAVLSAADGSLTFQDPHTVMAVLDPLKNFGPSVFGPLRFRPVDAGGAAGDWQPLTKLVRIPTLKEVRCPDSPDKQCTLFGTNLFLIDSVASDAQFTRSVPVPLGFASSTLSVPRPNGTLLYLKLRDDPAVINMAALPVLPEE
jgi:hypothetical protein